MIEDDPPELLPARMINEYVYCPRLFWLEYVERDFESSHDTVDGERVHRRVDRPRGELPDDITQLRGEATSVELSSERLGVVAKLDVVRTEGDSSVPVISSAARFPREGRTIRSACKSASKRCSCRSTVMRATPAAFTTRRQRRTSMSLLTMR